MPRPRIQLSFVALLGALGGFLVVTPLLGAGSGWRLVSAVLFLAVIASSLRVVGRGGRDVLIPGAVGFGAIALELVAGFGGHASLSIAAHAIFASYLAFVVVTLLRGILRVERVTGDAIAGGACVYLLIGMLWGAVFTTLELFQPGSFLQGGAPIAHRARGPYGELLYFSYVTVMTIGYGDILAATPIARMLAVLAALSGQLYLAVFVAGLVGMLAVQSRGSRDR